MKNYFKQVFLEHFNIHKGEVEKITCIISLKANFLKMSFTWNISSIFLTLMSVLLIHLENKAT